MPPIPTPDNLHQNSFRIKHDDDRFITKLLTKENPPNSSFRVYYKDFSGAVPFTWETRPGTPKHRLHHNRPEDDVPPLTPPPSYYASTAGLTDSGASTSKSKAFLHTLFRKITRRKCDVAKSPPRAVFSRSFREPEVRNCRRRRYASWGGDERAGVGKREKVFDGYSSVGIMKRSFLSIVGHRLA